MRTILQRFKEDKHGNFSFVMAAASIAVLGAGGVAVDFANATRSKNAVQNAADAAVLTATRSVIEKGMSLDTAQELARREFDANMLDEGVEVTVGTFDFKALPGGQYVLEVNGTIPTSLAQVMGYTSIPISVAPSATMASGAVEIAIAFDVTNSMGFGTSWSDSITIVENALTALKDSSSAIAITFIPFTDRVNVGEERADFLVNSAKDSDDGNNGHGNDEDGCDESNPGKSKGKGKTDCTYNANDNIGSGGGGSTTGVSGWGGCTEPRTTNKVGRSPYYMDDRTPNIHGRFNPFLTGTKAGGHPDYTLSCNTQPIVGPTSRVSDIVDILGGLTKGGTGRFDEGLVWAWRALSPEWKGYWKDGAPPSSGVDLSNYPQPVGKANKIAVLITDGHNTAYYQEFNKPMIYGSNNGTKEEFENLVDMCQDMSADGVYPHIMHINGNAAAEPFFRECASFGGAYYKVGNSQDLINAFGALNAASSGLRLTN